MGTRRRCLPQRIGLGRMCGHQRHLPHLRRWPLPLSCTQCSRTGLQSFAPPALFATHKLQTTHHELPIAGRECYRIPDRSRESRSAEGATERSPARRAGNNGNRNSEQSEHRRCDTQRSRIVVLAQTLKPGPPKRGPEHSARGSTNLRASRSEYTEEEHRVQQRRFANGALTNTSGAWLTVRASVLPLLGRAALRFTESFLRERNSG
jgi:hypothetical protein